MQEIPATTIGGYADLHRPRHRLESRLHARPKRGGPVAFL